MMRICSEPQSISASRERTSLARRREAHSFSRMGTGDLWACPSRKLRRVGIPCAAQTGGGKRKGWFGRPGGPFPSAEQATSWACVCPGNNESAGKQHDGRTRKGNPWLRRTICEAAWAASRTKKSYFHAEYKRI